MEKAKSEAGHDETQETGTALTRGYDTLQGQASQESSTVRSMPMVD